MKNLKYFITSLLVIGVFLLNSCGDNSDNDKKTGEEQTDSLSEETNDSKDDLEELEVVEIDTQKYEPEIEIFRDAMNDLYDGHVGIGVGLFLSNPTYAQTMATTFKEYLGLVNEKYSSGDSAISGWNDFYVKFDNYSTRIKNTADLNVQRKYFAEFAKLMYNAVNRYGLFDRDTYLFYCSEALNGKGGYWISNTKEIQNPYGEGLTDCWELKGHVEKIPVVE